MLGSTTSASPCPKRDSRSWSRNAAVRRWRQHGEAATPAPLRPDGSCPDRRHGRRAARPGHGPAQPGGPGGGPDGYRLRLRRSIAADAPLAVFATKQSAVEGLTLDPGVGLRQRVPAQLPRFRDRGRQGRPPRLRREATAPVAGALTSICCSRGRRRESPATESSSRSTAGSRPRPRPTRNGRSADPQWVVCIVNQAVI